MSYDLNVSQGLQLSGKAPISLSFGADRGGQGVRGVQKAVHRFVTLFLTEEGSVLRDPQRGTGFLAALYGGLIRTDSDVYLYYNLAADQALTYLQDLAGPADERLQSAELSWFDLSEGRLLLGVRIETEAAELIDIILPTETLTHA